MLGGKVLSPNLFWEIACGMGKFCTFAAYILMQIATFLNL
jgi:hypothetical protein